MPRVSILICTYNASESILATIKSCLDQTYPDIEILIHDDQSTDDTKAKISSLIDSRLRLVDSGRKLGPYGGLNFLLEHAQGEYCFLYLDEFGMYLQSFCESLCHSMLLISQCVGLLL